MTTTDESSDTLDVSDLQRHMGVPMRPGQLKEPVTVSDIRRWVQAMHYPNPLHYDEQWAAESRFGTIIAPQSFTVATDTSHGCSPAQVGRIADSHLIFGGDEWWFFGARIAPGDHLLCHRMPYDYKVAQTKFAGPTCFQCGDTLHINQHGQHVALQRSTAVRYRVRQAQEKKLFTQAAEPEWSEAQLLELDRTKLAFIDQVQQLRHDKRVIESVSAGDRLAPNGLGPHSLASFTTEWRAYPMTTWGAMRTGPTTVRAEELGYTREMAGHEGDRRMERINPELTDGAYHGPSRGHLQPRWAQQIGMPRGYGYGASMGAWILDFVSGWAGEWGFLTHASTQYRSPALTGDVTFLSGEVVETRVERRRHHVAVVEVDLRNQDGVVLANGTADVELPRERS